MLHPPSLQQMQLPGAPTVPSNNMAALAPSPSLARITSMRRLDSLQDMVM